MTGNFFGSMLALLNGFRHGHVVSYSALPPVGGNGVHLQLRVKNEAWGNWFILASSMITLSLMDVGDLGMLLLHMPGGISALGSCCLALIQCNFWASFAYNCGLTAMFCHFPLYTLLSLVTTCWLEMFVLAAALDPFASPCSMLGMHVLLIWCPGGFWLINVG